MNSHNNSDPKGGFSTITGWKRLLVAVVAGMTIWPALPGTAGAVEYLDLTSEYRTDLRAMAMGNAFGPIARGDTAMAYNPAGLAQLSFEFNIGAGFAIEGAQGGFLEDTYSLTTSNPSVANINNYLNKYNGTTQGYRTATFYSGYLTVANIGIGTSYLNQAKDSFTFNDANANAAVDPTDELILDRTSLKITFMSAAIPLMDEQILFGATAKTYEYGDLTSGPKQYSTLADLNLKTTGPTFQGTSTDIGFLYRMQSMAFLRPQMSLVAYNLGGTSLKSGAIKLEVPATYNWGMIFQPELKGLPIHAMASIEYEDITGAVQVRDALDGKNHERDYKQRMHMGAELGLWRTTGGNNVFNARVGLNRGLPTFGYELNLFGVTRLVYTRFKDNVGHVDRKVFVTSDAYQLSFNIGI